MRRAHLWDRYARFLPPRLLRTVALPLGRHANTDDAFRWESARMLNLAFGYTTNEGVAGDYCEFGVLEGRTFQEAWLAGLRYGRDDMNFHAYDSFAGLPEVGGLDADGPFRTGEFAGPRRLFDRVTALVPPERMTVTEGFFDRSLARAEPHPVAIAWIDCDLYESTVPVLDFLTDQLQHGSVLIFDDWFCFRGDPARGEQRACQEWLDQNPSISLIHYRDFHWAGRSFIVNRRTPSLAGYGETRQ